MKSFVIWGGTGQAKVVYEAIDKDIFRLVAIFDNRKLLESPIMGIQCFQGECELDEWLKNNAIQELHYVVAIGGSRGNDRLLISQKLKKKNLLPINVIHKTAYLAEGVLHGECLQMLAQSVVGVDSFLGKDVIVNTSASVDHDCRIGNGVHIGPGATIAGEVVIEDLAFVGAGAVVLPRLKIGKSAIIGAGAVVTKSIPSGATVVGNPAKPLIRGLGKV